MDTITLEDRYRTSDNIISRRIAGEAVLVPLRNNAANLDAIYALNETAALVWTMLDGTNTLRQTLDRVISEFDVEEPVATSDLFGLITHLESLEAIQKA